MFAMVVDDVLPSPKKGHENEVFVGGVLLEGDRPKAGAEVVIHTTGRPSTTARIHGIDLFHSDLPRVAFLLAADTTPANVEVGCRITSAPSSPITDESAEPS